MTFKSRISPQLGYLNGAWLNRRFLCLFICANQVCAVTLESIYSFTNPPAHPIGKMVHHTDGCLYGVSQAGGPGDQGAVFRLSTNGVLTTLASFFGTNGASPTGLTLGLDGDLYGTTSSGGSPVAWNNYGTVFRITTNGVLTTLAIFDADGTNGVNPQSPPTVGLDGNLYGTTSYGGAIGLGTIFRIATNGTFSTIFSFQQTNGSTPSDALVASTNGELYGTTYSGGASDIGTLFKITTGGELTKLYDFNNSVSGPGNHPSGSLVMSADGQIYGATSAGGSFGYGSIFRATTNGDITVLSTLEPTNGFAVIGLAQAEDGPIYGTTGYGGDCGYGTVFRILTDGPFEKLTSFCGTNGDLPSPLTFGDDGNLYGTTFYGGADENGIAFRCFTNGQLEVVARFVNPNGDHPFGGLNLGWDGNLYGTTLRGGELGLGTVFKLTSSGVFTSLASFHDYDGAYPDSTLLQGRNGRIYGTTPYGGDYFVGTAFEITTNGEFSVLASFDWFNGAHPNPGLVQGTNGYIYGTTSSGGDACAGTVFIMTEAGQLSRLVSFDAPGGPNPGTPYAGLTASKDGSFYGTTTYGGTNYLPGPGGCNLSSSRVFKMTPSGDISTFASFDFTNGWGADTRPLEVADGDLYGLGWRYEGVRPNPIRQIGTVFKVTTNGELFALGEFSPTNAAPLQSDLTQCADGYIYGTASTGGDENLGTVFRFNANGQLKRLRSLQAMTGNTPKGLVQAADGVFYGANNSGGSGGGGEIFRFILRKIVSIELTHSKVRLSISGLPGEICTIQASTNLIFPTWENLGTTSVPSSGQFDFEIPVLRGCGCYFRTLIP